MPPKVNKKQSANPSSTWTQERVSSPPPLSQKATTKTTLPLASTIHSPLSSQTAEDGDDGEEEEGEEGEEEEEEEKKEGEEERKEEEESDDNDDDDDDRDPNWTRKRRPYYNDAPRSCAKLMDDCLYRPSKGIKVPEGESPWMMPEPRTLHSKFRKGNCAGEDEDMDEDGDFSDEKMAARDEDLRKEATLPYRQNSTTERQGYGSIWNREEAEQRIHEAEEGRRRQAHINLSRMIDARRSGSPPSHVKQDIRRREDHQYTEQKLRVRSEAYNEELIAKKGRQSREPMKKIAGGGQARAGSESDSPDDLIGEITGYWDRQQQQIQGVRGRGGKSQGTSESPSVCSDDLRTGRQPVKKTLEDSTEQVSEISGEEDKLRPRRQGKGVIKRGKDSFIA